MRTSRKLWTVCRFQRICCFLTVRFATISLTADSTNPVEIRRVLLRTLKGRRFKSLQDQRSNGVKRRCRTTLR